MPLRPAHLNRLYSLPRCRGPACPYRGSSVVLAILGVSLLGGFCVAAAAEVAAGLHWL